MNSKTAFVATSLPLAGRKMLPARRPLSATPSTRQTVRAITRRVSDILRPEQIPEDKAERKEIRRKNKKYQRKMREQTINSPRFIGNPRVGFGPVGSPDRTRAEREARMKYTEGAPGTRDALMEYTRMLSGGKADNLLHTLRARYLERMHYVAENKPINLEEHIPFMYERLIDEILLCDSLYYADDPQPRICDADYDELVMHLLELERFFPELISPRSPSQNVAHGAAVRASELGLQNELFDQPVHALASSLFTVPVTTKLFPQYKHLSLMLSIDNAHSHEDFEAFVNKAIDASTALSAELKIDGVALSLEYHRGRLAVAATRGTGRIGDAITDNVRAALLKSGVVEHIKGDDVPSLLIIRGEVYITPQDFKEFNATLEKKLSNPRNAAAGALKHKNPEEANLRRLRFIAYDCLHGVLDEQREQNPLHPQEADADVVLKSMCPTQAETLQQLTDWGFGQMPRQAVCPTFDEAEQFALRIEEERASLPMEVDGIVFKFNDSAARENAGNTARAPRGAIAYKFKAQSKITTVNDVVMQVSRNGVITPVAVLEPVNVGGAVLSRATLHNFDEVRRLGIAIGDRVRVERGGDVIPKVTHVLEDGKVEGRIEVTPPSVCPSCFGEVKTELDEESDTTIVECVNSETCTAQTLGRVIHFSGKKAMNIVGVGRVTVQKLINSGHIVVLSDIFRLTKDDMLSLDGFAEKSATSICKGIEDASKSRSLERLIFGLGLPGVGSTTARDLAQHVGSLSGLIDIGLDQNGKEKLLAVRNVAEKSAEAIHNYLSKSRTQSELRALDEFVTPKKIIDEEDAFVVGSDEKNPTFEGKTFVFTGSLTSMSRPEVMKKIRAAGGKISNTVTNKTDYVVSGVDPGAKLFKAQRMRKRILMEDEFMALFQYKPKAEEEGVKGDVSE